VCGSEEGVVQKEETERTGSKSSSEGVDAVEDDNAYLRANLLAFTIFSRLPSIQHAIRTPNPSSRKPSLPPLYSTCTNSISQQR
jgi:hypothetical protein